MSIGHRIASAALAIAAMWGLIGQAGAQDLSDYSGAQLYQRYCAACHGLQGLGDGPVSSDIRVMVPDLTRIAKRHGGVFPEDDVRRIIDGRDVHMAHGTREMPVWGVGLGAADARGTPLGRLVEYLRSIQAK
jgi:cytochrome c1